MIYTASMWPVYVFGVAVTICIIAFAWVCWPRSKGRDEPYGRDSELDAASALDERYGPMGE